MLHSRFAQVLFEARGASEMHRRVPGRAETVLTNPIRGIFDMDICNPWCCYKNGVPWIPSRKNPFLLAFISPSTMDPSWDKPY
jgi:hypothetical protein